MDYNGSTVNLALIMGELRAESRHTAQALHRQTEILLDIKDSLEDLPSRLSSMIATPQTSSSQSPRILPELSELIRALYPPLILLAALVGKSALPGETGLLRAVLEAVVGGAGS